MKPKHADESGVVMVAVVCLAAAAAAIAAGLLSQSGTQMRVTHQQMNMDQAFYVAEAGIEQGGSFIRVKGDSITAEGTSFSGTIGVGAYTVTIQRRPVFSNSYIHAISTDSNPININPASSANNEFYVIEMGGASYDMSYLKDNHSADLSGTARTIYYRTKAGDSPIISVDGASYTMAGNKGHRFDSQDGMTYSLVKEGNGNGHWYLAINGNNVRYSELEATVSLTGEELFSIESRGTFNGKTRTITIDGLYQQSWARYALWYDHAASSIYVVNGEEFNGPVHANTTLYFDTTGAGNFPRFHELLSTAAASLNGSLNDVTFDKGYLLNAPLQTMASINFTNASMARCLKSAASLVITGQTAIRMDTNAIYISNASRGWTNNTNVLTTNMLATGTSLVYVVKGTNATAPLSVGGTLAGRLTLVVDDSIWITNHLRYATHPTNNSQDALGLIARGDVVVRTNAPNNVEIFAHIISTNNVSNFNNGFYVQNYDSRATAGLLNVYGGIVENNRGAVGSGTKGFKKNYQYDTRFTTKPPPFYPATTNEYSWHSWRDK